MRRVLTQMSVWVCCLLLLVGLVGCTTTRKGVSPVTSGFTCAAEISYRELELVGQLTRYDDGKLVITFASPPSLSDLSVGWNGEEMTMELGGISVAVAPERVPQSALIKGLLHVLSSPTADAELKGDTSVVSGTVDGVDYTLVCDGATGLPRSISMPDNELEARFLQPRLLTTE